MIYWWLWLF